MLPSERGSAILWALGEPSDGLRITGPAPPGAGQEFDAAVDNDKQRRTGAAGADKGLSARVHRIGRGGRQRLLALAFEPLEQGGAAQCDDMPAASCTSSPMPWSACS